MLWWCMIHDAACPRKVCCWKMVDDFLFTSAHEPFAAFKWAKKTNSPLGHDSIYSIAADNSWHFVRLDSDVLEETWSGWWVTIYWYLADWIWTPRNSERSPPLAKSDRSMERHRQEDKGMYTQANEAAVSRYYSPAEQALMQQLWRW